MKHEKGSFIGSLVVAALALLALAAAQIRESQARAPATAVAAVRPDPGTAGTTPVAAPEDSSEIIGQIEPLLVGSPAPHREQPRRSARR